MSTEPNLNILWLRQINIIKIFLYCRNDCVDFRYFMSFFIPNISLGLNCICLLASFPFNYGFYFNWTAFIGVAFIYVITTIESTGDLTATSMLSPLSLRAPASQSSRCTGPHLQPDWCSQPSTLRHGHKGALNVRVNGGTEYWAFLIVVTSWDMDIVSTQSWVFKHFTPLELSLKIIPFLNIF